MILFFPRVRIRSLWWLWGWRYPMHQTLCSQLRVSHLRTIILSGVFLCCLSFRSCVYVRTAIVVIFIVIILASIIIFVVVVVFVVFVVVSLCCCCLSPYYSSFSSSSSPQSSWFTRDRVVVGNTMTINVSDCNQEANMCGCDQCHLFSALYSAWMITFKFLTVF